MIKTKAARCERAARRRLMPSPRTRAACVRQDVIGIVAHAQREWLHGHGLPVAEIWEAIDVRIDTEINEAVQDALRENGKS
jgi:hypothetical protein